MPMHPKTQATLVGGLAVGVLSALPVVSAGNLCCCLWVVGGGMVAALLAQQGQSQPLSRSEGAVLGLRAGLVGAVVYLVLSVPITIVMTPLERALILRMVDSGNLPPQFRDYVAGYGRGVVRLIFSFVFMLIAGAIFSSIGGILGAVVAGRRRHDPPKAVAPTS
jgi:hypothetical protein